MTDLTVAEVLDRAAELLEERGWGQGWYIIEGERLCPAGAIGVALGGTPGTRSGRMAAFDFPDNDTCSLWMKVWDAADAQLLARGDRRLTKWNDEPGRTVDEVKALLRAAIEQARAVSQDA